MLNSARFILLVLISIQISSMSFIKGGVLAGVIQLPDLVEHFEEHQLDAPSLSWIEFLNLHYGNSDHMACADADHDTLPLTPPDANSFPASSISFEFPENIQVQMNVVFMDSALLCPAVLGKVKSVVPSIFHPPS